MSIHEKIEAKRKEMEQREQAREKDGRYKKERDIFLLWGEYPKGWQMIKDSILCIMLINALIGHLEKIDLSYLMEPKTITIINEAVIRPAEASETIEEVKPAQMEEKAAKTDISEIVAKVHRLESSGGKNDGCLAKGKVNGYGYAQNKTSWVCYNSHEEVKKLVEGWFERELSVRPLPNALCRYNTGTPSDTCTYWDNYKAL